MNIAIIGATGDTGRHFLKLATGAGHQVRALARHPDKLETWRDRIEICQADGRDVASLRQALDPSVDVVVDVIGASSLMQARKVRDLYSTTAANLVEAMQGQVARIVAVTSSGVVPQPNDSWFYRRVLKRMFLARMYEDMVRMEYVLRASGLDYIVARPPYLTKGAPTGTYRIAVDDLFDDDDSLRRGDLAHFLLRACESEDWHRVHVALSE